MTGTINLGDNYSIEEDSNGDLVITDNDGSPVLSHDSSDDTPFKIHDPLDVADLIDTALPDEIDTAQINNDAVDTTQIANAAVVQAVIKSGAVTVDELADALGTGSNNKIPGTTYLTDVNVEALEAGQYQSDQRDYAVSVEMQGETVSTEGVAPDSSFELPGSAEFESLINLSELVDQSSKLEARLLVQTGGIVDADVDFKATISPPNAFKETPVVTFPSGQTFTLAQTGFVEITDNTDGVTNLTTQWRGDGTNTVSVKKTTIEFLITR